MCVGVSRQRHAKAGDMRRVRVGSGGRREGGGDTLEAEWSTSNCPVQTAPASNLFLGKGNGRKGREGKVGWGRKGCSVCKKLQQKEEGGRRFVDARA